MVFRYGERGLEVLIFWVRRANGKLDKTLVFRGVSRSDLARVLWRFRKARRVLGCSSRGTFGGGFPHGSLRWVACHSGIFKHFSRGKMRSIKFSAPCLRSVLGFVG